MAINYYLNNRLVKIDTNACFVSTQDETLDSGTLILEWDNMPNAILPQTKFRIEDTSNNDVWDFVIKKDDVEVIKKGTSQLYQHNLTVEQNTSSMTKHCLRDSVFAQPTQDKKCVIHSHGHMMVHYNTETNEFETDGHMIMPMKSSSPYEEAYYRTKVYISSREKFNTISFKVESMLQKFNSINVLNGLMTITRDSVRTKYNGHFTLYLRLNKYDNENDATPSDYYDFEIPAQATEFLLTGGYMHEGWYELVYRENPEFYELSQSDISFNRNTSELVKDDTDYPTLLGMVTIEAQFNTYYWTLYDVISQLRKQNMREFNRHSENALFNMPTGDCANFLQSIVAPEFKFNSVDVFTAVSEVLNYVDAVPTIDRTNHLAFEFLNDIGTYYNGYANDRKKSLEDTYFVDALISNYQNGKQPTPVDYPARKVYRRVTANTLGIVARESYIMQVPHQIDYIQDCYIELTSQLQIRYDAYLIYDFMTVNQEILYENVVLPYGRINIKEALYESTLYSTLSIGSENSGYPNQKNTLQYSRGSNEIKIGVFDYSYNNPNQEYIVMNKAIDLCVRNLFTAMDGTFSKVFQQPTQPSLWNMRYSITYFGIFDGRMKQESREHRYNGSVFAAQSSANTDLNRMGTNMEGLIAKLGNEETNIQFDMSAYGSRIKKGSCFIDSNGFKWIATSVKTTFSTSSSKVFNEVNFTKNYNGIGKFTSINQEKRFYEISNQLTSKGYDCITEYIYFSTEAITDNDDKFGMTNTMMRILLNGTLTDMPEYQANYAAVETYDYEDVYVARPQVQIPLHIYGAGNSLCFEMGYEHPLSAGTTLSGDGSIDGKLSNDAVMYSGDNGFAEKLDAKIYAASNSTASDEFPLIPTALLNNSSLLLTIDEYKYFKRSNEILHFNYQIAFMPHRKTTNTDIYGGKRDIVEDVFIGQALVNNNAIIPNRKKFGDLWLYISENESDQYSIRDIKCRGTKLTRIGTYLSITHQAYGRGYIDIEITSSSPTYQSGYSWAIGDENGNLLIGVNKKFSDTKHWRLYFAASGNKIYN